jgi:uncharacterized membrane protein
MANRRGYGSVASAWWLIGLGIVLLFIPPLFWLGLVLIFGGIILGLAGWFEQEGEEREGIRESGDRASEYLGGITGGWIIALGVVLFIIPTPLTTLIGILVILVGIGVWLSAWWGER